MNKLNSCLACITLLFSMSDCTGPGFIKQGRALEPFAVSYEKIEDLRGAADKYKLLIVEPDQYSKAEADSLTTESNKVIAYVTLGEVDRNRWYYPLLEKRGFLGVNEYWDSPYLNLADSTTRSILLDQVIPNIMSKGFDGLFLDTVDDVAPYTERSHLQPFMEEIIGQIRSAYPDAFIIQNAGLFLLDSSHKLIDAVLIEDVATSYNFENQTYNLKGRDDYREKVKIIEKNSNLYNKPFLIVDFSDKESLTSTVIKRLDTLPYPYFIGSIQLNNIWDTISSRSDR